MNKIAASTTIAAIALVLLALPGRQDAQQAAQLPGADAMQAKAEKVRDALLKGTVEDLFGQLAPWIQGRAALTKSEGIPRIGDMTAEDKTRFEKKWKEERAKIDPANLLKIETFDEFTKITDAQMLGLTVEYFFVRGSGELEQRRKASWHLVDRSVGFEQYQETEPARKGAKAEAKWLTRTRAKVVFMSATHRDLITVYGVAEGDVWQVDDFEYRIGKRSKRLADTDFGRKWSTRRAESHLTDAWRTEGEQLLGSLKNRAKVAYAKTGNVPSTLTADTSDGGCGVQKAELAGKYFTVRDKVVETDDGVLLMAEANEEYEDGGAGVLDFSMLGRARGDEITWFPTLEDLYRKFPEFKE